MREPPRAGIQTLSFHEKGTMVEWYVTDLLDWSFLPVRVLRLVVRILPLPVSGNR